MKKKLLGLLFVLLCPILHAQIKNIVSKYDLPSTVSETSGLLFYKGKLLTHNDSGDAANLYEIDTLSGNITRTIEVSNASNVDWEAITQDENYVYIGDFGNNNGNRQDLKIYRILKSDYDNNTSVSSEVIAFSYEDQEDFTTNPYNHDFDAEAFTVHNNQLILFTKNWASSTVSAYTIPKDVGNHTATKIAHYNVQGLITDAAYNPEDNSFLLCGYNRQGNPLLVYVPNITIDNLFDGTIERTDITTSVGLASQIEGLTHIEGNTYFLSRERVNRTVNGIPIQLNQRLFRFNNGSFETLSNSSFTLKSIDIYPNPSKDMIYISGIDVAQVFITDSNGKNILKQKKSSNQIRIGELTTGVYFLKIIATDKRQFSKKIIKN